MEKLDLRNKFLKEYNSENNSDVKEYELSNNLVYLRAYSKWLESYVCDPVKSEWNLLYHDNEEQLFDKLKDLQHFKDSNIALYATDKDPETLFKEIFVHLIEKIDMDGEKTFSPMDFEYYEKYFNRGINLLMWRI